MIIDIGCIKKSRNVKCWRWHTLRLEKEDMKNHSVSKSKRDLLWFSMVDVKTREYPTIQIVNFTPAMSQQT